MCVFLCMDTCVQVCVYMAVYVHGVHVCARQGLMLSAFINHFPPYFLRQDLLLKLELTDGARLDSQEALRISLPLPPQWQECRHAPHTWLFTGMLGTQTQVIQIHLPKHHFTDSAICPDHDFQFSRRDGK